jgi:phosphatidylethanolamine-binding protein (PEBP) family uncharacterized protein
MERRRMNKRGWLKVLEAVIAIAILIGVLLYIMTTSAPKKDMSTTAYEKEKYILDTISKNDTLRSDIIDSDNYKVNLTIEKMIPNTWGYETRICELAEICNGINIPLDKDVYAAEIVVTSTDNQYTPKKLRLFVWEGIKSTTLPVPPMAITETSGSWINGQPIPADYTSGGNIPKLTINNIPPSTKSLLLILEKSDGTILNWIVWDIPPPYPLIISDNSWPVAGQGILGRNTVNGNFMYKGPHVAGTYIITVYALNIDTISLDPNTGTKAQALTNISGHVKQTATYTGTV